MTRCFRRFLALALCVLLGLGLPLYTTYAAPVAEEHHAMMAHGEGMPDCGSQGGQGADCAQFCAAVCAGMALPAVFSPSALAITAERVAIPAPASFESHAGPPGLQPPR